MSEDIEELHSPPPIEMAVLRGDRERFDELFEEKHLDWQSDNGSTLLHKAAILGRDEMAKHLIDRGIDLDTRNDDERTPLHVAVDQNHLDVVETLVEAGADLNVQDKNGVVPLFRLIHSGDRELVRLLLARGADPAIETDRGVSPLDHARRFDVDWVLELTDQY